MKNRLSSDYINQNYQLEMIVCTYPNVKVSDDSLIFDSNAPFMAGDNIGMTIYGKNGDIIKTIEDLASLSEKEIRQKVEDVILNYETKMAETETA